jgi:hypothetical protein
VIGGPWEFDVEIVSYALGAVGWKIVFYDKSDKTQKVGELSSDIGRGYVSEIGFNLVETGCGDFEITLGVDPSALPFTVEYNQGVEIYLYHDPAPWYAGYIFKMPASGSTERPWKIEGAGYYNQLQTCIVDKDYTSTEISDIVRDLMDDIIEEKTDILYADYKIATTDYTVSDIQFDHATAKKAIEQLADLAQGWIFGVDANREIFFRGIDPDVNPAAIFAVGKHISEFNLTENAEDVANRVYVKVGLSSGGTNIQAEVSAYNSQVLYGIREKVLSAPSLNSADDAQRWGNWQLDDLKRPKQKAKIPWADCSGGMIEAKGKARILDNDGTKHEIPIKKVAYSVDSGGIGCSIELGDLEKSAGRILRDILFDIANQELIQEANA